MDRLFRGSFLGCGCFSCGSRGSRCSCSSSSCSCCCSCCCWFFITIHDITCDSSEIKSIRLRAVGQAVPRIHLVHDIRLESSDLRILTEDIAKLSSFHLLQCANSQTWVLC